IRGSGERRRACCRPLWPWRTFLEARCSPVALLHDITGFQLNAGNLGELLERETISEFDPALDYDLHRSLFFTHGPTNTQDRLFNCRRSDLAVVETHLHCLFTFAYQELHTP